MVTLDQRAANDPSLYRRLVDLSRSNREVGREYGINESVVRRWRTRQLSAPNAQSAPKLENKGGIDQWKPGVDLTQNSGELRTEPLPSGTWQPKDETVLQGFNLDPNEWQITSRHESRWQNARGEWLSAHKLGVERIGSKTGDLPVSAMTDILKGYMFRKVSVNAPHQNKILVVPIGDLQVGKIDGGGTPELIDRFGKAVAGVRARMQREGSPELLIIPVLGDCIEGITAMGGKLATRLDISVTEQVRVYRRLLLHMIAELSVLAKKTLIVVLPGNHDENYRAVQQPVTDSWAIEGASAVEEALTLSGNKYDVTFVYPQEEELVITVNVGTQEKPYILGFTHGHLVSNPDKVRTWWAGQSLGRQAVASADILLSAHFHHLRVESMSGGRTWIQIPALDGGSEYYRRETGANDPSGIISFWVTPHLGNGWQGLTVHSE